jgi:outer membrane protein assembly factor BamB/serine/threonine protein kinase
VVGFDGNLDDDLDGKLGNSNSGNGTPGNGTQDQNGQDTNSTTYLQKQQFTTLAFGTVLQQRYRIESVLGLGGMGAVYRVRDLRFANATKYCALKEMIAKFSDTNDERTHLSNFEREANILASLSHLAIPAVHDYFTEHGRAYLVLEYIEGRDLEALLRDTEGVLPEQLVGSWAMQLCDVLQYLHGHQPPIIFRDLKPSNVILTPSNQIVLIDFGIAKTLQEGKKGTMVGTEGYSPPEQYRGVVSPRSDIYALGAMMHHLLTRSDPRFETPFTFAERMPRALNPAVSEAMEVIIMRCVEYDPEQRFGDVIELRTALESALKVSVLETGYFRNNSSSALARGGAAPIGPTTGGIVGTGLIWKFQTGDEVRSSPLVANGTVYVGSYDQNLFAIDARTGREAWRFATEGGICGTPAIWKHLVFVGSEDFNVYGIQADDGHEVWTYRTWQQVRASPRVHGEAVYIGSDDGFLHALEPRNGRPLWKYRAWRPVRSSAAYANGLVIFGSDDDRVYAVDALTGEEKWRFATIGGVTSSPAIGHEIAYVGSMDFCVYALDTKMGWVAWRERTGNFVVSSPCYADERVYVGSVDQHLYCLDAKTGRVVWKFQAGGQINSSPAVANGVVYVGCVDGGVYAIDAATGRQRWRFQTGGPVPSSPAVVDDLVYIGSMDGCVYALRA